jgi:hypothetical protein
VTAPRLILVTEWNQHHPWPSLPALRYLIFHEHSNGFARCVRRVGKRVLIHEGEFFKWVDERHAQATRQGGAQ